MMRSTGISANPAEQYIDNVITGNQVACKWVRLACQRHRQDLVDGEKRGLWFDPGAAIRVIEFFNFCRHSKGAWAGQVLRLEPWQQAILWILFGWKRADGTRRFRLAYMECARKNGKSTLLAGLGLYLMIADREPGAEIYSAATKRDQARIVHLEARRMVRSSQVLRRRIKTVRDNLHIPDTAAKFEPFGRDADSMDGLNVHGALVDELHAHPTSEVWDVLESATGARRQSMLIGITTAGFSQTSFCYQLRDYVCKILDGVIENDAMFGIIYSLDEGDQWKDEETWVKANPNLGVSVYLADLQDQARKAARLPSALTSFLTKRLSIWTKAETKWLHPDRWRACGDVVDLTKLANRPCFAGLDLSNTLDITAWVLVFPPTDEDPMYRVLARFWVPGDAIDERSHNDMVPYDAWAREGWITAIPGAVIDYEFVYAQIDQDMQDYDLREIGYDRWGAPEVYLRMARAGATMVQIGQGYIGLSAPMKKVEELVAGRRLAHGNNPVLTWMAHNVVASRDPAGNIKPDKAKSREKIDGILALIMGLDRATRHSPDGAMSVYDERGIMVL